MDQVCSVRKFLIFFSHDEMEREYTYSETSFNILFFLFLNLFKISNEKFYIFFRILVAIDKKK